MKPLVSVVMPAHGEPLNVLDEAVESILRQTFASWELLLVNDNPGRRELKTHLQSLRKRDERIVVISPKKNLGRARARNLAVHNARGRYIAILDADDVALPERLERQSQYLQRHQEIDLVFSWATFMDEHGTPINAFRVSRDHAHNITEHIFRENILLHPSMMCKVETLREEPYDESFVRSQDFEFWLRCAARGLRFDILEEELIKYRVPAKESYAARIDRQRLYTKYTFEALRLHSHRFRANPWFHLMLLRTAMMRLLLLLPASFLRRLLIWKDRRKS